MLVGIVAADCLSRMGTSTRDARGRARAVARTAACALLVLGLTAYVAYLAVANWMLRSQWLRAQFDGDALLVDYDAAWTIFPGPVHVEALRVRLRDSSHEVDLRVGRADVAVDRIGLSRRRFHANRVRASGVELRERTRLLPWELVAATDLDALPTIPGFGEAPWRILPPSPPRSDAEYDLFAVQLEDVVAEDVREVWLERFRFRGSARAEGAFLLQPERWFGLADSRFEIASGNVAFGMYDVATDLKGEVEIAHGLCHGVPRMRWRSNARTASEQIVDHRDDREHEQEMYPRADCRRGRKPDRPQQQQDDGDCPEHAGVGCKPRAFLRRVPPDASCACAFGAAHCGRA
jgi:hypothetical protein